MATVQRMTSLQRICDRNGGYWDGVNARARGRYPVWAKGHIYRQTHPCNKNYGEGFWIGWYGEPAPKHALVEQD